MANDQAQEKTEEATEKRKTEAREKGQVARSKELNTTIILLGGLIGFVVFNNYLASYMYTMFYDAFTLNKNTMFTCLEMKRQFAHLLILGVKAIVPFLLLLLFISAVGPMLMGGINFSSEAIAPKLERLDPIQGIKKIISWRMVIELVKAVLKFILIAIAFLLVINVKKYDIFSLDELNVFISIPIAIKILFLALLAMASPLLFIVAIDIPFQIWNYSKQLKMTKQEVQDEHKDTEGKPEVKSKIKKAQMEIRKRRMMSNVPKADVIITNPTHFAVAIAYKEHSMQAPVVVAKGVDLISEMIKKVAKAHEIPIVSIPELARTIYYTVDLEDEIPTSLYVAVAKVLAYAFELKLYKNGEAEKPVLPDHYPIPDELKR